MRRILKKIIAVSLMLVTVAAVSSMENMAALAATSSATKTIGDYAYVGTMTTSTYLKKDKMVAGTKCYHECNKDSVQIAVSSSTTTTQSISSNFSCSVDGIVASCEAGVGISDSVAVTTGVGIYYTVPQSRETGTYYLGIGYYGYKTNFVLKKIRKTTGDSTTVSNQTVAYAPKKGDWCYFLGKL